MDITKTKEKLLIFLEKNFNLGEINLLRKYEHIQVVADYCLEIATELDLDEEDKKVAYVIGLLHDYGRFTQWKHYQTYNDLQSCSHAKLGAELLFNQGEIKNFEVPEKHYEIIKTVILQHSSIEIDKTITDPKKELFCKIIRDADKVNLYELNINGKLPILTQADGSSPEVVEAVKNGFCVRNEFVKTKLDTALLSLATTYDLNFAFSFKKLKEMQYFEKMEVRYSPLLNYQDNKLMKQLIEVVKENLAKNKKVAIQKSCN